MEYRHLGRTGIRVSEISFGSWVTFSNQVDIGAAIDCMSAAYDAGVNFFDNAEAYADGKAEEVMGAALQRLGWRRSSYLISTKLFWGLAKGINEHNTLNRKYLIEAIDASLQRLKLDHVDLLYCHRPDPTTPIGETVWAMHDIIEWGKALYWGTSQWSPAEIIVAIDFAERNRLHAPVVEQPQYNLFIRERFQGDYVRVYKEYGYGATTWSPLHSGLLSGKYAKGIPKDSRAALAGYEWLNERMTDKAGLAKVGALEPIASELGCTLSQLAIGWCLKNPLVSSVITGASRTQQVRENMQAAAVAPRITPELMKRIDIIFDIKAEVGEEGAV